jgi:hypothetical protein
MKDGILKDEVHATSLGHAYYAEEVQLLIKRAALITDPGLLFDGLPRYISVLAHDICKSSNEKIYFSRGGYSEKFVKLSENEVIMFDFEEDTIIRGYTCLLGPQSGFLDININGDVISYLHYDQFCYYNRMHGKIFPKPSISSRINMMQNSKIPDVKLLKGEQNVDERLGAVGRIFIEQS